MQMKMLKHRPIVELVLAGKDAVAIAAELALPESYVRAIVSSPLLQVEVSNLQLALNSAWYARRHRELAEQNDDLSVAGAMVRDGLDRQLKTSRYSRRADAHLANEPSDKIQQLIGAAEERKRKTINALGTPIPDTVPLRPLAEAHAKALVDEAVA